MKDRVIWGLVFASLLLFLPVARSQLRLGSGTQETGLYRPGGDGSWLLDMDVMRDLNLSKEQAEKINLARQTLGKLRRDADIQQSKSPKDNPDVVFKTFNDEVASLVKVLNEKQRTRLKQLVYQLDGIEPFFRADVRKALQLNGEQEEALDKMKAAYLNDLGKVLGNSRQQAIELRARYSANALELLTNSQKDAWATLTGTPLKAK
jgi:hypothetical protein